MEDDTTVQTVFAEKQPFKEVENYFTNALLYQEIGKISKEPLPDNNDSGNEADSESEEDMPATLVGEPMVACFNPQCNNPYENDDEWVINDNVCFDYPASVELFESITNSSLHMPCINQACQVHLWNV